MTSWRTGSGLGRPLEEWETWALVPPLAAGPLPPGSDRDIYNSQLCRPGPNGLW